MPSLDDVNARKNSVSPTDIILSCDKKKYLLLKESLRKPQEYDNSSRGFIRESNGSTTDLKSYLSRAIDDRLFKSNVLLSKNSSDSNDFNFRVPPKSYSKYELIGDSSVGKSKWSHLIEQEKRDAFIDGYRNKMEEYSGCKGITRGDWFYDDQDISLSCLQYSPDGNYVIAGFNSGSINLCRLDSQNSLDILQRGRECGVPITSVKFHPITTGIFYASSISGSVTSYSVYANRINSFVTEEDNEIYALDICPVGKTLVTVGKDASVRLYDILSEKKINEYGKKDPYNNNMKQKDNYCHEKRIYAVRFNPNMENVFITGGWDRTLKVWDVRDPIGCVNNVRGPFINGDCLDVKCYRLLSASWNAKTIVQVWDLRYISLEWIRNILPENLIQSKEGAFVISAKYFSDDPSGDIVLLSSLSLKSLDVMSIKKNLILHYFCSDCVISAFHSHGNKVMYGGARQIISDGNFYIDGIPEN